MEMVRMPAVPLLPAVRPLLLPLKLARGTQRTMELFLRTRIILILTFALRCIQPAFG